MNLAVLEGLHDHDIWLYKLEGDDLTYQLYNLMKHNGYFVPNIARGGFIKQAEELVHNHSSLPIPLLTNE